MVHFNFAGYSKTLKVEKIWHDFLDFIFLHHKTYTFKSNLDIVVSTVYLVTWSMWKCITTIFRERYLSAETSCMFVLLSHPEELQLHLECRYWVHTKIEKPMKNLNGFISAYCGHNAHYLGSCRTRLFWLCDAGRHSGVSFCCAACLESCDHSNRSDTAFPFLLKPTIKLLQTV